MGSDHAAASRRVRGTLRSSLGKVPPCSSGGLTRGGCRREAATPGGSAGRLALPRATFPRRSPARSTWRGSDGKRPRPPGRWRRVKPSPERGASRLQMRQRSVGKRPSGGRRGPRLPAPGRPLHGCAPTMLSPFGSRLETGSLRLGESPALPQPSTLRLPTDIPCQPWRPTTGGTRSGEGPPSRRLPVCRGANAPRRAPLVVGAGGGFRSGMARTPRRA